MKNVLFYMATVVIWGTTWIGIKMQLGTVEPIVSVAYRFGLAALILAGWSLVRKLDMRFSAEAHGFMFLQGMLLFGFNYLLFYVAELYVASGLAAVIFSTIVLMNIVNGSIFLKSVIDSTVVYAGVLGLIGITLVFKAEITSFSFGSSGFLGISLCVAATLLASLGNIVSARNQKNGLPIVQTNVYGMGYGALAMIAVAWLSGRDFGFELSYSYIGSLFYLALFGSVVAFGCYLTLIGKIGADRAAYATLLFPIVALAISTIWEDYHWTLSSAGGVLLILTGNLWILKNRRKTPVAADRNSDGPLPELLGKSSTERVRRL